MRMVAGLLILGSPSSRAAVMFTAGTESVASGGDVSVPISVSGFTAVSAFQFTLSWDTAVLTLNPTTPVTVSSFLAGGITTTGTPEAGKLTFIWEAVTQATIADDNTIFWVEFSASGGVGTSTALSFIDVPTARLVTFFDTTEETPVTIDGSISVVPEPANYALGLFAGILSGTAGVRWLIRRRMICRLRA